ncbi:MAG: Trimeric GatFAB AmidoTransferase(AdT) complex subunit [Vezdaea aestivalis]|nr:MAG: Trimeric GatFAB AmidoTransferase(AdT) complex subunit [Vezdaea aestivalis]
MSSVPEETTTINAFIPGTIREGHAIPQYQIGPLSSYSIAVKDNICATPDITTCGSNALSNYRNPYDATVVRLLKEAGARIAGKTNLDEFGMGSHSTYSRFGHVQNALDPSLSAGGSSGGSAVAVASGQCTGALGTDTGGSVRLPAAYNGIFGFKPSYGLLSRRGVIAYSNSLDTVGILARNIQDTRQMFGVLNKHDPKDPTSMSLTARKRLMSGAASRQKRDGSLRIGVPVDKDDPVLSASVKSTWISTLEALQAEGHVLYGVSMLSIRRALSAYYVIAAAEASSNLGKYDGVRYGQHLSGHDTNSGSSLSHVFRGYALGPEVQRRIMLGTFSLSADAVENYFRLAQRVRGLIVQGYDKVFALPNLYSQQADGHVEQFPKDEKVDIIINPTTAKTAPRLDRVLCEDPTNAYLNDIFTVPPSLAGLPSISIPISGDDDTGTIGLQVTAQFADDNFVLRAAEVIEQSRRMRAMAKPGGSTSFATTFSNRIKEIQRFNPVNSRITRLKL